MAITKSDIRTFLESQMKESLSNLEKEYKPLKEKEKEKIISKFSKEIVAIKLLSKGLTEKIEKLFNNMKEDKDIGIEDYRMQEIRNAEYLHKNDWEKIILDRMTVHNEYKKLEEEENSKYYKITSEYRKLDKMITSTNSTKQILTSLEALGFDTKLIEIKKRENSLLVINANKDNLFYPNNK